LQARGSRAGSRFAASTENAAPSQRLPALTFHQVAAAASSSSISVFFPYAARYGKERAKGAGFFLPHLCENSSIARRQKQEASRPADVR